MTATLVQVLDVVRQRLAQAYPSLGWTFGAKMLAANDWKPPHVIITPSQAGDRFEPADYVGQSPRCYRMLVASLVAHCRGADFESTERLRHDVASALVQTLLGNVQLIDGGWASQDGSVTYRGEAYVLRFELRLPVVETLFGEVQSTAVATIAETPSDLALPGGDVPNTTS